MSGVQVVRGAPDDDELAAVVASLAALAAATPPAPAPAAPNTGWQQRVRLTPGALPFGPPGWSRT
ncbi:acyl-CoA carboxylase epsilon subunit [Buchananella hordeovulneris]|uniref:acyl-CoA carboxylase epsilon subunit n=1 Tax=Buchananella hordeovulneris TaxID=52770 RepID=UPI000F5F357F|nr:acyl-CoA carboxylase epsilon subunit [Buchananella hordeovulneris]RRD44560.1 acyl-CoA carboxylase subunit epsilon [Buchananella hordeovulneris]